MINIIELKMILELEDVYSKNISSKFNIFNKINKNLNGGILLEEGIYGKCLLPNSNIIVNDSSLTIEKFAYKYNNGQIEELKVGAEKWFHNYKYNYFINSYDKIKNIIEKKKIKGLFIQKIHEFVREIILDNGVKITTTLNHKFLVNNKILTWKNAIMEGDFIVTKNENEIMLNKILKINIFMYSGNVYDLSIEDNYCYFSNNILCHNTSKPIIQQHLNKKNKKFSLNKKKYNFSYLIICPKWRFSFWKSHFKNSKINDITISISFNKKNKNNSNLILINENLVIKNEKFEKIMNNLKFLDANNFLILDYFSNKKFNFKIFYEMNFKHKWIIFNFYKNTKQINNILNIFDYNSNKFIFFNETCLQSNIYQINKSLYFNELEMNNYKKYINKFSELYMKNNINFYNDEYLQKYCSYPQKKLIFNSFHIFDNNLSIELSNNCNSYKSNIIETLLDSNKICNICLENINNNNIGITICGHIYCYTCLYESLNYKKECPKCRCKLNKNEIFLYNSKNTNILDDDQLKVVVDKLGTKIYNLLKIINLIKEDIIIISNFDENIIKISSILDQLNLKNEIILKKKIILKIKKIFIWSIINMIFIN